MINPGPIDEYSTEGISLVRQKSVIEKLTLALFLISEIGNSNLASSEFKNTAGCLNYLEVQSVYAI